MNPKIFVIGFNKSATTSIDRLFKCLGLNSVHSVRPVLNWIQQWDAFSDGEPHNFDEFYECYPEALFILNVRPIGAWLRSRYKHAAYENYRECWCWPISDQRTLQWIDDREKHYAKVLAFFEDKPGQLLVLCATERGWEHVLLEFLRKNNVHLQTTDFHEFHENARPAEDYSAHLLAQIDASVDRCLQLTDYTGDELLLKDTPYIQIKSTAR